jgi:hypothetical protein
VDAGDIATGGGAEATYPSTLLLSGPVNEFGSLTSNNQTPRGWEASQSNLTTLTIWVVCFHPGS